MYTTAKTGILLQTAHASVSNPNAGEQSKNVRLILDLGSQKSYITENLRRELNLPSVSTETLVVKTFGNTTETARTCDIVQTCIRGTNSDLNIYVSCYAVPVICSPLACQPVQFASSHYSHLRNLELADSTSDGQGPSDIDILIGADFFWHIVTGNFIRGEHGPVAMETKLRYVLSGPVTSPYASTDSTTNFVTTHLLRVDTATELENSPNNDLHEQLKKFWELEAIGVKPNENPVYDEFKQTIEFN